MTMSSPAAVSTEAIVETAVESRAQSSLSDNSPITLVGLRLNQAIAHSGLCSRKAAARLISEQRVLVNGQQQPHHYQVKTGDAIQVDGEALPHAAPRQCWLYHKPVGVDCNVKMDDPSSIAQLLTTLPLRLFPLGRLDKDSSGLLLLSNDGALAQQLMHADQLQQKEYRVEVDKMVTEAQVQHLATGVSWQLGSNVYQSEPCLVSAEHNLLTMVLTQGLNRQIRYMCRAVGLKVLKLHRVRINQLQLTDGVGSCRPLTAAEMLSLTTRS
jgi:16S rRNA pseudouridine516 synthase